MAFAGDAEAKKKNNKKKKAPPPTSIQAPIPQTPDSQASSPQAPGTTFHQPPTNAYLGESVARAWGYNDFGQLGNASQLGPTPPGTPANSTSTPVQVSNLSGLKGIDAGDRHSLALKTDGTVWAWGSNEFGQLGDGTPTSSDTPINVSSLSGIQAIAAGDDHSLALQTDGTVWIWGHNDFGQLGDGTSGTDRKTPVKVSNLSGVKAIAAGGKHSLALKTDGTVWTWGYNYYGQLGDGTTTNSSTPVQVSGETPTNAPPNSALVSPPVQGNNLSGVTAITAGRDYSLALKEDATVRAWGNNRFGQLGDANYNTSRKTPVKVSNLSGVKAIAAGDDHNLALKTDGTVWAWGYNYYGQLGNGTSGTDRNPTPLQVSNLSGVQSMAAGSIHSLALKTDGTVWAWGNNHYGQLGDVTYTDRKTPVKVNNLSGIKATAAGGFHSLAIVFKPPVAQQ
jgi:alpha-tubulin suppressor-like RCC1 family protein